MHFDLSEEQKAFQESVERTLTDLVDLSALAANPGLANKVQNSVDAEMGKLGVALSIVPSEAGGLGMGLLTLVAIAQVLGRHSAPASALETALAARLVAEHGSDRQRERWLPGLLAGDCAATFALSAHPESWTPDEWGSVAQYGPITRIKVRALSRRGLTIFSSENGLSIADVEPEEFRRPSSPLDFTRPLASLEIDRNRLDPLCGKVGAWRAYEALLVLAAADAAGAGQRALEMTVEYAKLRQQFDRPIGSFQALKHQLANMALEVAPLHLPCWHASHMWDLEKAEARRAIFLAKAHATDVSVKAARSAIECHGGVAYTWDYPLHIFLKRAMQDRMTLSSPTALRKLIATMDDAAHY
jgi:alkylation response protein AidB-like acyl-CoA dehydrogenase